MKTQLTARHIMIKTLSMVVLFLLVFTNVCVQAATKKPLTAHEAFQLSTEVINPNSVNVRFNIAKGYYLYRQRFNFETEPATKLFVQYPAPEMKKDIDGKPKAFYGGNLVIPIQISGNHQTIKLFIAYQGCSKDGFCYPPQRKAIDLNLLVKTMPVKNGTASASSLQMLLKDQNGINELLYTQQLAVIILLFIGLGLLLSLTPCVLPMVPILTSIIVGQKHNTSTKKAFLLSATYVLGMAVTYSLAGVAAALLGNSLQLWLQQPLIIVAVSLLFVLLSLSLFGFYNLQLPGFLNNYLQNLNHKTKGGHYTGVFSMGVLSTLVVSPCVTAPLVGVLMYIGQTGNVIFGATALFALGIGMGIPLLLIGMSAGRFLPKSGAWMELIKKLFGFVMLGTAIWMLSRVMSAPIVMLLWGLLLVSVAIYFLFVIKTPAKGRLLIHTLAGLIGFAGMLFLLGGAGLTMHFLPLATKINEPSHFIVIRNINDFKKQLHLAQQTKKPIILDFYADWCDSCITMDKKVFRNPSVQTQLQAYTLLRADLSAYSAADNAILKQFNVIAPPTILFFDTVGKEIADKRIVGEVDANEFLTRLNNKS